MPCRRWCLAAGLCCCLTCAVAAPGQQAGELWQKGQEAMRAGRPEQAIGFYEASLRADPSLTRNHLSLAAAHLERGEDLTACAHLGLYVADHPEHVVVRTQYVELLLRLKHTRQAEAELNALGAYCQDQPDEALGERIHCESRLVDLADGAQDEYASHLHRGIGLYLVARQRARLEDPAGELPVEALLCRSASELKQAWLLQPRQARPAWYLYVVWSQLGQADPARQALQAAAAAAPFGDLTSAENRRLLLARRARGL